MLETLSIVLQEILLMKKAKNFTGAQHELNITAQKIIGLELKHIETFSESKIIELLKLEKDTAHIKLYVTGVLLKEEASLMHEQNLSGESAELYLKSLSLLLESYLIDLKPLSTDHIKYIEENLAFLKEDILPENISLKIFNFYEITGSYGKAEDILFELAEKDPAYYKFGLEFYERLLIKNDDDLNKGNLPKEEVEESLRLIKSKMTDSKN